MGLALPSAAQSTEPSPTNAASAFLTVVATAVLAGNVFIAVAAISSDGTDIVGVEYSVTHAVQRLALGHPLYSDPESPPFSMIQYTPLHYQVSAALVRALNVDPHDAAAVTQIGRSAAAFMWTATACLIAAWLLRMGSGLAAALALVAWWTTQSGVWWFLNRPDSAESLLFFLVLAMMARTVATERPHVGMLVATGLASVLVGYAKQNGWFESAAFIAFFVVAGKRRAAGIVTAGVMAGHLLLHGLAWQAWGAAWPNNIYWALDNGIKIERAIVMAYQPVAYQASWAIAVAAVLAWRSRRSGDPLRGLFGIVFLLTFVFAAVTALKLGSGDNYFIDAFGVAVLLIGVAIAEVRKRNRSSLELGAAGFAVVLLLFVPIKLRDSWMKITTVTTYASLRPVGDRAAQLLADKPGAWAFVDSQVACLLPERTLMPQLLLSVLAYERKTFSYASFSELVANGEVAVVVFRYELPSEPSARPLLLGASLADFTLVETIGPWHFYLHNRYPQVE